MQLPDSYLSISEASEGVFRDKGSKFLAYAFPVVSQSEINNCIQLVKKTEPSARHYCYAWRLGADKKLFRANDDGEPAGTAGKPILGQIISFDLSDLIIIVARYFGGTLLGTTGLINAYRTAASEALNNADKFEKLVMTDCKVEFDFNDENQVMRILKNENAKIIRRAYNEKNIVYFKIRDGRLNSIQDHFKNLYLVDFEILRKKD